MEQPKLTLVYKTYKDIGSAFNEVAVEIVRVGDTDNYIYRKGMLGLTCAIPLHESCDDFRCQVHCVYEFTSSSASLHDLHASLRQLTAEHRIRKEMIEMFDL